MRDSFVADSNILIIPQQAITERARVMREPAMSSCCNTPNPKKHTCPVNGRPCNEVPIGTVMHHISTPWMQPLKDQAYYFCDDPDCEIVYFGSDNSTIDKASLRTVVGIKETANDSPICYCFGVNRQQSQTSPEAKAFVVEQTKSNTCSCTTSNPSGACCLKDFPK